MEKKFDTVLDTKGNPVEGASVQVNNYPAGGAATIYSDDGVTLIAGGTLTTGEDGAFSYYADNGRYSWFITTDDDSKTINDIIHDDPTISTGQFVVATGTGDAMVVAAFDGDYVLVDGDDIRLRAVGENTVTNPTINLPDVGVLTIYKHGGQTLNAQVGGTAGTGDIRRAGHEIILRYRATPERMELIGVL